MGMDPDAHLVNLKVVVPTTTCKGCRPLGSRWLTVTFTVVVLAVALGVTPFV
jgi:hypothetical protein